MALNDVQLAPNSAAINLTARRGEVVAITGLLGSGKSQLAEILFGLQSPVSGNVTLNGEDYTPQNPAQAVAAGVFMSSKDRSSNAVIPIFDIADNMALPFLGSFSRLSLLNSRKQRHHVTEMIKQIGVVCQSERDSIGSLSGGNQQKVMIARWLMSACKVLLLDEPFQGVDIGARRDIGKHIRATAQERATIVFVAEIDEALEIADRIVVLNEGSIAGEHANADIDLEALIAQVSGAKQTDQSARPVNA